MSLDNQKIWHFTGNFNWNITGVYLFANVFFSLKTSTLYVSYKYGVFFFDWYR